MMDSKLTSGVLIDDKSTLLDNWGVAKMEALPVVNLVWRSRLSVIFILLPPFKDDRGEEKILLGLKSTSSLLFFDGVLPNKALDTLFVWVEERSLNYDSSKVAVNLLDFTEVTP